MKRKNSISLGPGAPSLILIFVVLSLSALGMLSLMTARNDRELSERSAEVIEAVYALNTRAEESMRDISETARACGSEAPDQESFLAALPGVLPEGVTLQDGLLCWQETDDSRVLDCALEVEWNAGVTAVRWRRHVLSSVIAGEDLEDF